MNKILILILSIFVLSGCAAGLDKEYSCTKVGGVAGCTSMDEIRENIDVYAYQNRTSSLITNTAQITTPPNSFMNLPRRDRKGAPTRTDDVVKKVTIFPFIDKDGHYVDTTDIYIILDDSCWTGRPVHAIWKD